jgi:hypothetical protein
LASARARCSRATRAALGRERRSSNALFNRRAQVLGRVSVRALPASRAWT